MGNDARGLPAGFAEIPERGRRFHSAARRDAGIVAEKIAGLGKKFWPRAQENLQRAAPAGFGFDCVRQ